MSHKRAHACKNKPIQCKSHNSPVSPKKLDIILWYGVRSLERASSAARCSTALPFMPFCLIYPWSSPSLLFLAFLSPASSRSVKKIERIFREPRCCKRVSSSSSSSSYRFSMPIWDVVYFTLRIHHNVVSTKRYEFNGRIYVVKLLCWKFSLFDGVYTERTHSNAEKKKIYIRDRKTSLNDRQHHSRERASRVVVSGTGFPPPLPD